MKARVFISCGQRIDTEEVDLAQKIAAMLEKRGYAPYVAVMEKSLRGLKENLFERLLETEYFLFIDTRRERISKREYRGSLFCHQELAIAAFLEKRVLPFQQAGIRKLDGVMALLQANAIEFKTEKELLRLLAAAVKKEWKPNWRNELIIEVSPKTGDEVHLGPTPEARPVRYWFLTVKNRNIYSAAHNCYGYLRKAHRLSAPSGNLPIETVEYKWTGFTFPNVTIPPGASRQMDAFTMYFDDPKQTCSRNFFSDSRHFHHFMNPAGEYLLEFCVHSDDFEESTEIFYLSFDGKSVDSVIFREASETEKAALQ